MDAAALSVVETAAGATTWRQVALPSGQATELGRLARPAKSPRVHFSGDRRSACLYDAEDLGNARLFNLAGGTPIDLPAWSGAIAGDIFFDAGNQPCLLALGADGLLQLARLEGGRWHAWRELTGQAARRKDLQHERYSWPFIREAGLVVGDHPDAHGELVTASAMLAKLFWYEGDLGLTDRGTRWVRFETRPLETYVFAERTPLEGSYGWQAAIRVNTSFQEFWSLNPTETESPLTFQATEGYMLGYGAGEASVFRLHEPEVVYMLHQAGSRVRFWPEPTDRPLEVGVATF